MRTIFLACIFVAATGAVAAQTAVRQLAPLMGAVPDVSARGQARLQRRDALDRKEDLSTAEKQELKKLQQQFGEIRESVWDVEEGGCSWSCAGGAFKIVASSELSPNHAAAKAKDFSLQYAWAEGAPGNGIGESLTYYFKNDSPRINQINIYNGYLKSTALWQANNRVKKLRVWQNDKAYAVLNLRDSPALQQFKVPLLGHRADKKDLVLRFEILDIYPGSKHKDTVLTEIFFDGIDDH